MNKTVKILIFALFLAFGFSSCIDIDEPIIPTQQNEQADLKLYLDALIKKGVNVDTTAMGNYYVELEKGTGVKAKQGDTLIVGYAGYFVNGTIFDASEWHNPNKGTMEFFLGNPPMIKGWDDGMKLLNKNAKIQLILPSVNAYGAAGASVIPPYTTLVFVVKLIEIKPV